ncbi:MAG TPA: methyltransferase domain-containing protein [Candidatus Wallbacteria bacterium]|nr:methyltransferase domain-containing protein [Candidatus Wallbacteria bacterium]
MAMKVSDIRPETMLKESAKLWSEDSARILAHKKKFVKVDCPACRSKKNRAAFEKGGFNFVECVDCETLFINPRPTFELLIKEHYSVSESAVQWNDVLKATEIVRRKKIFAPRARLIAKLCEKYGASKNSIVDVGTGIGTFCEEIKKLGVFKKVIAVEPTARGAEICRQKGIETIEKPVENAALKNVGVITNFELIEHLFCPETFLAACANALQKNGLFVVTTPNIKGFDLITLREHSENVSGVEHLNYFHPKSLTLLLERCGFAVEEVLTPGKLDAELVRIKALSKVFDISGNPFLKNLLIDEWDRLGEKFQKFLAANCLSSHMWVVARKK